MELEFPAVLSWVSAQPVDGTTLALPIAAPPCVGTVRRGEELDRRTPGTDVAIDPYRGRGPLKGQKASADVARASQTLFANEVDGGSC